MNFEDLKSPEFQEKLKNVSSPDELLGLAFFLSSFRPMLERGHKRAGTIYGRPTYN